MRLQNETFWQAGLGEFQGELLARDAGMIQVLLVWLDAPANRVGSLNENLARELMELFTLGVGNFAEADVQQAARALTGLSAADGEFRERPTTGMTRERRRFSEKPRRLTLTELRDLLLGAARDIAPVGLADLQHISGRQSCDG